MQQQHERVDEPLRLGDCGLAVLELRHRLRQLGLLANDEITSTTERLDVFDQACDQAVRSFQQQRGLRIDGVVDRETYRALDEARWRLGDRILSFAVRHPYVGDDVAGLQHRLIDMGFDCGRADGVFGARTENALRDFQRNVGLPADGTCGPATFRALRQLARTVVGGKANELREYERLHHGGPTMAGKLVVIDPGHGGRDRGATNGVLDEASIVDDIANRVEGRLTAAGTQAFRTRGGESLVDSLDALERLEAPPTDAERAAFANAAEADLVVSLHVDGDENPSCHGISTYYYGTVNDRSLVGARLADLIQQEILGRTDLLDSRSHPKTWELLRTTRMPAVRIELGYLTNPGDAARLSMPDFRDELAEAIVVAIQRLFSPAEIPSQESIELSRHAVFV
ncbi:MAG: N-acetylmuramoyl-L-alanine amidase [Actinomycetota bacterium]|nr:N-acetylmuramoyl-L-alanine amidase [Actinomycetota bacterium]